MRLTQKHNKTELLGLNYIQCSEGEENKYKNLASKRVKSELFQNTFLYYAHFIRKKIANGKFNQDKWCGRTGEELQ